MFLSFQLGAFGHQAEKHLLKHILRPLPVAGAGKGQPVDQPGVPLQQLLRPGIEPVGILLHMTPPLQVFEKAFHLNYAPTLCFVTSQQKKARAGSPRFFRSV